MTQIVKISKLHLAGSELFEDAESFLNELTEGEMNSVVGGGTGEFLIITGQSPGSANPDFSQTVVSMQGNTVNNNSANSQSVNGQGTNARTVGNLNTVNMR